MEKYGLVSIEYLIKVLNLIFFMFLLIIIITIKADFFCFYFVEKKMLKCYNLFKIGMVDCYENI